MQQKTKGINKGNQTETSELLKGCIMDNRDNVRDFDLLERYRTNVYGTARNDFNTVENALFDQTNRLAVVCKAVESIEKETSDNDNIGLLMGVSEMLNEVLQTMNQALSLLDKCELERG